MKKGKLIAIEGIDGVGKNTQAKLLHEHIVKTKGECGFFSFPRYDTPTGMLVGAHLKETRTDLDLMGKANLWSDDRLAAKEELWSYLDRGVDVVCDRYYVSNVIYFEQFAKMEQPELSGVIGKEIEFNELVINGIPPIDILLTLSVSLDHYDRMMESKSKRSYIAEKLDKHEVNAELIKGCHKLYGTYGYENGILVICDENNAVLDISAIHSGIVNAITKLEDSTQPKGYQLCKDETSSWVLKNKL